MNSSVLEELSPSDEELCARSGPEEDSGTCSSEEELENCWESEETVPRASDELSGSIPGFTPVTPVEESESLPQLAQKNPITDRQLNRIILRISMSPSFFLKYIKISYKNKHHEKKPKMCDLQMSRAKKNPRPKKPRIFKTFLERDYTPFLKRLLHQRTTGEQMHTEE
jgi:hypothetical protein